jgi:hypothetical protein
MTARNRARASCDPALALYRKWQAACGEYLRLCALGAKPAKRERFAARVRQLEELLTETPATSAAGVIGKFRVAAFYRRLDLQDGERGKMIEGKLISGADDEAWRFCA